MAQFLYGLALAEKLAEKHHVLLDEDLLERLMKVVSSGATDSLSLKTLQKGETPVHPGSPQGSGECSAGVLADDGPCSLEGDPLLDLGVRTGEGKDADGGQPPRA